jgi:hypothetical protein
VRYMALASHQSAHEAGGRCMGRPKHASTVFMSRECAPHSLPTLQQQENAARTSQLSLSHVQLQVHTSHYIPGAYTTPLWRVQGARGAPAAHGTHAHMSTTHQQRERPTDTLEHMQAHFVESTWAHKWWLTRRMDATHGRSNAPPKPMDDTSCRAMVAISQCWMLAV